TVNYVFGQSNTGKIEYVAYFNLGANDKYEEKKCELFFTESESLFKYQSDSASNKMDMVNNNESSLQVNMKISSKENGAYYFDKKGRKLISKEFVYNNGKFDAFIITEDLPKIKWKLINEVKQIGSFKCSKAETNFRGRNYTVWYTSEIPISSGPWKLSGLPGLILEAIDTEKQVHFKFLSATYPVSNTSEIVPPSGGKSANMQDYISEVKKEGENFKKYFLSKLPRGTQFDLKAIDVNILERSLLTDGQ
ncbi:MAG: GLPGLI family protein, partial [Chryseotalea sp.]